MMARRIPLKTLERLVAVLSKQTLRDYELPLEIEEQLALEEGLDGDWWNFDLRVPAEKPEDSRLIARFRANVYTGDAYVVAVNLPKRQPSAHGATQRDESLVFDLCSNCHRGVSGHLRETLDERCWRWTFTYTCRGCGFAGVTEGEGLPPGTLRAQVLRRASASLNAIRWTRALQERLHHDLKLTVRELPAAKHGIPGPLVRGTREEMEVLSKLFATSEIETSVEAIDRDSTLVPDLPDLLSRG
jgi:hypothetical protein